MLYTCVADNVVDLIIVNIIKYNEYSTKRFDIAINVCTQQEIQNPRRGGTICRINFLIIKLD